MAGLSLIFDGVGGCLGRGIMKLGVAWDVGVTLWPWRSRFISGVSHPHLKREGFGLGHLGGPFSSDIPRLWACYLYLSRLRTAVLLWGLLKAVWKWKWKTLVMSDSLRLRGLHSPCNSPWPEYWSGSPFPSPGDLPNPGIKPRSPALQEDSLPTKTQGKPKNTGWVAYPFSGGSFRPRNWTRVSCIAGRLFTNWAIREAQRPSECACI